MVWIIPAGSESVCLCRERCLQNSSCGLRSTPRLSTPLLYTMYTKSIGEICRRHNVLYHCYADDIQLYCAAEGSEDLAARLSSINECIDELKSWMGCNMLKLNSEKNRVHHICFEKVSWLQYDTIVAMALVRHKHIFLRTVSGCNF